MKGLITEAGPLTYPENASINEDNCVIFRTGNRSRRFGVGLEEDYVLGPAIPEVSIDEYAFSEFRWESAGNDGNTNFTVVQTGLTLHFYDLAYSTLSAHKKLFTVDMTPYVLAGAANPASCELQFAGGKGYLFVVGEKFEPILVSYNPTSDTIAVQRIYIVIRDFKGVDDGLANDQQPATLDAAHHYNLRNQGWVSPANTGLGTSVTYYSNFGQKTTYPAPGSNQITEYYAAVGRYPANNQQWFLAKATASDGTYDIGDFRPDLLQKISFGNTRAPQGYYLVEAFNIDRSAVSGIAGLPIESSPRRPVSTAFGFGRAWYLHDNNVYFSQMLDDKRKAGFCYQDADPTSEDISDLLPTDGGVIPIPEMAKGVKLYPFASGMVVFGTNGVWYISGGSAGFTALDISVSKINAIGLESPRSVVEAEGQLFWWSKVGIMAMTAQSGMFGPVEGSFDRTNISEQTIQTFYNNEVPDSARPYVKGVYDPATNVIQWLFKSAGVDKKYFYNRVLNYDLTLQAFYPWTITSTSETPWIIGVFQTTNFSEVDTTQASPIKEKFVKFLTLVPNNTNYHLSFSLFNDDNFADWGDQAFLSYVETGYEILEDVMRKKWAPYVFVFLRRTEENYVESGDDFTVDYASSCKFQVKWDWASTRGSNKWTNKIETYRHGRLPMFDEDDPTFDTGYPMVVTKNKVRGNGRAIQFRFENGDIGSDFDLYGWAVSYSGNTNP